MRGILSKRADICNGNDVAIVLITRTILFPSYSSRHKRYGPIYTTRLIDVQLRYCVFIFPKYPPYFVAMYISQQVEIIYLR